MKARNLKQCTSESVVVEALLEAALVCDEEFGKYGRPGELGQRPAARLQLLE